jgi:long-chain acyl-CoA synthetase
MSARGLRSIALEEPNRSALVAGDRRWSFADLDGRASAAAHAFADAGVGHGDRVAVMLHNTPELFAVWFGAARVGAFVVPISYRAIAPEVAYLVEDSGAKAFVYEDGDIASPALASIDKPPRAWVVTDDALWWGPTTPPNTDFQNAAVTPMNYTSGTTGKPKGIVRPLPQPAPEAAPSPFAQFWGFTRNDVHLLCGPAYHTAPGSYAYMHLLEGASVVIMDRFDADECLRLIETERVTTSHMVPANFVRILEVDWARYDRSSVRKILHAAAPCPVDVKRRIIDVFPPGTIWEYYGASEGMATVISPEDWLRKPGSVGSAFPGVSLRVVDDEGNDLPPNEVGTILIGAFPGMPKFEYHNAPEKTAGAWRGEYFSVGDLGHLDEDGFLFFADRRVDLILAGGVNIYPFEIEQALAEHPEVVDAAVFGLPDERMGQRTHAVVEPQPQSTLTADQLLEFLSGRLAKYKLPRTIEFIDELPREPSGKVLKRKLRDEREGTTA